MTHIAITLLAQLTVGWLFGRWALGGLLFAFFYLGREITQAEYRWISTYGDGKRANMPFWGGFDPAVWSLKSLGDAFLPIFATAIIYLLAVRLRHISPAARSRQD